MIDECIIETINENQKSIFQNENRNHIQILESKRRKRINKSYLEIEYGYKIREKGINNEERFN